MKKVTRKIKMATTRLEEKDVEGYDVEGEFFVSKEEAQIEQDKVDNENYVNNLPHADFYGTYCLIKNEEDLKQYLILYPPIKGNVIEEVAYPFFVYSKYEDWDNGGESRDYDIITIDQLKSALYLLNDD